MKRRCLGLFVFSLLGGLTGSLAAGQPAKEMIVTDIPKLKNLPKPCLKQPEQHLIDGCIDPVFGTWNDREVDLEVPGLEPLKIERYYHTLDQEMGTSYSGIDERKLYVKPFYRWKSWSWNHGTLLEDQDAKEVSLGTHSGSAGQPVRMALGSQGQYLEFSARGKQYRMSEEMYTGWTNEASGWMGAAIDPHNHYMEEESNQITLVESTGLKRRFELALYKGKYRLRQEKEKLYPNGSVASYTHKDPFWLTDIQSYSPKGDFLGSVELSQEKIECRQTGHWVKYELDEEKRIRRVERSQKPKVSYEYQSLKHFELRGASPTDSAKFIIAKHLPQGCYRRIEYYDTYEVASGHGGGLGGMLFFRPTAQKVNVDGYLPSSGSNIQYSAHDCGRVKAIYAPVGPSNQETALYRFEYLKRDFFNLNDSWNSNIYTTKVTDCLGNVSQYIYDNVTHRLAAVVHEDSKREIQQLERFRFDSKGRLLSYWTNDGHKAESYFEYEYDQYGNPLLQRAYTPLNDGNVYPACHLKQGLTNRSQVDVYEIKYEFFHEPYHLKKSESYPDGKRVEYRYKAGTDLPESQLTSYNNFVVERRFYEYDRFGQVCLEIEDDGSGIEKEDLEGVRKRLIYRFHRYERGSSIGLVREETQSMLDLDTQEEIGLVKREFRYNRSRLLACEKETDLITGVFFEHFLEHDDHGNVIREISPRGAVIERVFDACDNLVYQKGPEAGVEIYQKFDLGNRLIERKSIHPEVTKVEHFAYDPLGRKIETINDLTGIRETYGYDYAGRLILTQTYNGLGQLLKTHTVRYNLKGQVIYEKDGQDVHISGYNGLGMPVFEEKPTGATTRYIYDKQARLKSICYNQFYYEDFTLDFVGRIIQLDCHACYSLEDKTTRPELQLFYDSSLLSRQVDVLGHEDSWQYDGAGRQILHTRTDAITGQTQKEEWAYDGHGRILAHRRYQDDEHYVEDHWVYNALGDVIECWRENNLHEKENHQLFEYDEHGHCISKTLKHDGLEWKETSVFDSLGHLIEKQDGDGHVTLYFVSYGVEFEGKTHLRKVEEVLPTGDRKIIFYDGRNLCVLEESFDAANNLCEHKNFKHNENGRIIGRVEKVLSKGVEVADPIVTKLRYRGPLLVERIDAAGTDHESIRQWTHDMGGRLLEQKGPGDLYFQYLHDARDRLEDLYVKQRGKQELHLHYSYDRLDRMICVENKTNHCFITRDYDAWGRMIEEGRDGARSFSCVYDGLGHPVHETYFDNTSVDRLYTGGRLRKLTRNGIHGGYSHEVSSYNELGMITHEKFPENMGQSQYVYDAKGRIRSFNHPGCHYEDISYDALSRLTGRINLDNEQTFRETFEYDALSQLTKEQGVGESTYSFDSHYRRLESGQEFYTYDSLDQIVSRSTQDGQVYRFNYDTAHRVISFENEQGLWNLSYDVLSRLIKVESPSETIEYSYDPLDRMIERRVERGETQSKESFEYFNQFLVSRVVDGAIQHRVFIEANRSEQGDVLAWETPDELLFAIRDVSGSIIGWINRQGETLHKWRFDAFGKSDTLIVGSWGFCSKYTDDITGWINFGKRHYSPYWGRWLTRDPKGEIDSSNLYAYLLNDPLLHRDLWGLERETKDTGIFKSSLSFVDSAASFVAPGITNMVKTPFYDKDHPEAWGNLGGGQKCARVGWAIFDLGTTLVGGKVLFGTFKLGSWGVKAVGCGRSIASIERKTAALSAKVFLESTSKASKSLAKSSYQGANLAKHLHYSEKYGKSGIKHLKDGRVRYYGELKAPQKTGEMAGRRYVHEFDAANNKSRGWHETVDHNGTVRQVRPELGNGEKLHYRFDSNGNYLGLREYGNID